MTKYYREIGKLTPLNKGLLGLYEAMLNHLGNLAVDIYNDWVSSKNKHTLLKGFMDEHAGDYLDGEPFYYRDGILYSVEVTKRQVVCNTSYTDAIGVIHYEGITSDEAHELYEKDIWEVIDG